MKKNKFIADMVITSAVSIALSVSGTIFRVFVSNRVGAECMGMYQLVYALYVPACTLAASGINIATVRMISASEAKQRGDTRGIMSNCFKYSMIFGISALILLFTLAEPVSESILKMPEASVCLKILAFGLPFLSAASAINGYFIARKKILKTLLVQLTEDLMKMAVTVFALFLFKGASTEKLCAVLVLGSAAGEIFSCITAILFYLSEARRRLPLKEHNRSFRKLLSIALPTAISSYVRSGLSSAENMLVPFGYEKYGYSQAEALKHIGTFKGMVMPVIMFPSSILNAAAKLLVPEIAYAYEQKNTKKIEHIATKAIYSTLIFSFFIMGVFTFFAKELCNDLYHDEESGVLLMLLAALIPILYLDGIVDAILKGINEQLATMRYSIIDSLISICLMLFLLPCLGVHGYVIVTYISSAANTFMGISRFLRITDIKLSARNCIFIPLLSVSAALLPVLVFGYVSGLNTPPILDISVSAILYVFFLLLLKDKLSTVLNALKHFRRHSQALPTLKAFLKGKPSDSKSFKI